MGEALRLMDVQVVAVILVVVRPSFSRAQLSNTTQLKRSQRLLSSILLPLHWLSSSWESPLVRNAYGSFTGGNLANSKRRNFGQIRNAYARVGVFTLSKDAGNGQSTRLGG
jgi:hypothetical protein